MILHDWCSALVPTTLLLQEHGTDIHVSFPAPPAPLWSPLRGSALGGRAVVGVWLEGQLPSLEC